MTTSLSVRRAIVWAWLACGILDITSAVVITILSGSKPARMLQGIAASVLGPQSFEMGAATAILGLAMHFLVALSATLVFYLASRRWPAMLEHPVVSGILFGVFWLLVMYRGVIPALAALRPMWLRQPAEAPASGSLARAAARPHELRRPAHRARDEPVRAAAGEGVER